MTAARPVDLSPGTLHESDASQLALAADIGCPVVHQQAPTFEQVGARVGRLGLVPHHVRQRRLDHLPRVVCPFLWKWELQQFADDTGLRISVCHFPPGTSKWNKIEHRMFCHITENWRGRPLVSREVVVNLIGHTTTRSGLAIRSELDANSYPTGQPVTAEQMESLSLKRDKSHGDWNYRLTPREA